MSDINKILLEIINSNTLVTQVYSVDVPLPYSSVRRKLELKRREDIFRKQLLRKKQSERIRRKYRLREQVRLRVQKCRQGDYGFEERIKYYDAIEKSYWYYLRRKYGISRILTKEEFDEHLAPHHKVGLNFIVRKDKSRKDWFLDNIQVTECKYPTSSKSEPTQ